MATKSPICPIHPHTLFNMQQHILDVCTFVSSCAAETFHHLPAHPDPRFDHLSPLVPSHCLRGDAHCFCRCWSGRKLKGSRNGPCRWTKILLDQKKHTNPKTGRNFSINSIAMNVVREFVFKHTYTYCHTADIKRGMRHIKNVVGDFP